jgi:sulfur-oxidizing protein SoxY
MTLTTRRLFLKTGLAASTVAVGIGSGLLTPRRLLAAWPEPAFAAQSFERALQSTLGTTELAEGAIDIHAPEIAENGSMVAITVESAIPDVTQMALFIVKNNRPLAAQFMPGPKARAMFSIRVKMAETSDVVAAVKANGRWYGATQLVKVTLGGCGG